MANELTHYYLQQMGIQAWVVRDALSSEHQLTRLSQEVSACQQCPLHEHRRQTVFSKGNPLASLMIISEALNHLDEQESMPFAGRSGILLKQMLTSIGLDEQAVYMTTILKCRVPENTPATLAELDTCQSFLVRQIELVSPNVLFILGQTASQYMLKTSLSLNHLRQLSHSYQGIPCVISYHPDELLAHAALKKQAWQDLLALQKLV